MINLHRLLAIFSLIFIVFTFAKARSPFRPLDPCMPELITKWIGDTKTYHFKHYNLEYHALFTQFNKNYFFKHLVPQEAIPYRYKPKKSVSGKKLSELAEQLVEELYQHKKEFTHFKVLKESDFNRRTVSGYLIVKFKKYPFVLKLSIETPKTFVSPFSKGWQPGCFFIMSGGVNRYLTGFTRLQNLEKVNRHIAQNPEWSKIISTPRKWFWIPKKVRWFEICGKNIGTYSHPVVTLPSVYGVICDAVKSEKSFSIFNSEHCKFALKLSHFLGDSIDSHIDNFMFEKGTDKIVLVDTEHFPTVVGLKKPLKFESYTSWYLQLACKYLTDRYGRTKRERRLLQSHPERTLLY